ncbi:MAG: sulfite reductase [Chlamydiota bacterium]
MYSRTHPYLSRIKERFLLTAPHSTKKTYHIALNIEGSGISFKVGDSIAVLPSNDPAYVEQIIACIGCVQEEEIFIASTNSKCTLREFLTTRANIAKVNTSFFKLLCEKGTPSDLLLPEKKAELTEFLHTHTLLDLLKLYPVPISPSELAKSLMPLMPRFYSIASSPKIYPNEIHLTVAHVSYESNGQTRFGVGTHFLCDRAVLEGTPIPIYIQPSHNFTLPSDPAASMILIGPGTGIAPFRAFLQERLATAAPGRNWLFFGERNRASDFYYQEFWTELEKQGRLRLDLAFSRDSAQKVYVQHKMLENKKSLWDWLQNGSYLYVCGDAEQMAKDVDAALQQIAREVGGMNEEDARKYIRSLRTEKRYLLDVY